MNKNTNIITILRENFDSETGFKNAIKDAIAVLLDNNYIMTVRWEEKGAGIVAIDYNYGNEEFGDYYPRWLLPEEWESICFDRRERNED